MNQKEANKILQKHLERLSEHFDCVSVIVSCVENGKTYLFYACHGNIYATEGMLNAVVEIIKERINGEDDYQESDADEDDAEEWEKQA